ncbi:MAG: putative aggregation factor core protein MAFp3, isoform, partial [Chitinophagaceae bacterium]|nr:putative aggregation factor core protein MAFp3, isoform [Chitinophagaceae bacterium]
YHGNSGKIYNSANLSRVPSSSPETNMAFADMDDNGKAALVHLMEGGYKVSIHYDIYNYPGSNEFTKLAVPFRANSVNVADFNKDGILDILATPIDGPQAALFFGLGNRKYRMQLFDFKHQAYSCAVGDLNNDGLLDAVTCSHKEISILLGSNLGGQFHFLEPKIISTNVLTTRVSMADFNKDGWLDILTENLQNDDTKSYDIESWVLINNKGSFSIDNKRSFHTFGANGGTVAQLKGDGKLDVVISNYHADISRRTGVFILQPDKDGFPADQGRVSLPAYSSGANLVLDFNGDGYQDIIVYNHTGADVYNGSLTPTGGMHGVGAVIYWGDKNGYSLSNSTHMPSFGPHSRISADPGSMAERNSYETYTSQKISNTSDSENFDLTITGRFNEKQFVSTQIMIMNDAGKTETIIPKLVSKTSNAVIYQVKILRKQTFQYKLNLNSANSGNGPVISDVKMEVTSSKN